MTSRRRTRSAVSKARELIVAAQSFQASLRSLSMIEKAEAEELFGVTSIMLSKVFEQPVNLTAEDEEKIDVVLADLGSGSAEEVGQAARIRR